MLSWLTFLSTSNSLIWTSCGLMWDSWLNVFTATGSPVCWEIHSNIYWQADIKFLSMTTSAFSLTNTRNVSVVKKYHIHLNVNIRFQLDLQDEIITEWWKNQRVEFSPHPIDTLEDCSSSPLPQDRCGAPDIVGRPSQEWHPRHIHLMSHNMVTANRNEGTDLLIGKKNINGSVKAWAIINPRMRQRKMVPGFKERT